MRQGADTHQLGEYVRRARLKRKLSIRQLAAAAHVDFSWLARLERGLYSSPDPRHLRQLARVLAVGPTDLYALAGYEGGETLPGFAPYLRAKYDLPPEAIAQLEAHFELLNQKYHREQRGGEGDVQRDQHPA